MDSEAKGDGGGVLIVEGRAAIPGNMCGTARVPRPRSPTSSIVRIAGPPCATPLALSFAAHGYRIQDASVSRNTEEKRGRERGKGQ